MQYDLDLFCTGAVFIVLVLIAAMLISRPFTRNGQTQKKVIR
jgi:hypothetical protein